MANTGVTAYVSTVGEENAGQRARKFIYTAFSTQLTSRRICDEALSAGCVRRGDKVMHGAEVLTAGDIITLDSTFTPAPPPLNLALLTTTALVAIIWKPAGVSMYPGPSLVAFLAELRVLCAWPDVCPVLSLGRSAAGMVLVARDARVAARVRAAWAARRGGWAFEAVVQGALRDACEMTPGHVSADDEEDDETTSDNNGVVHVEPLLVGRSNRSGHVTRLKLTGVGVPTTRNRLCVALRAQGHAVMGDGDKTRDAGLCLCMTGLRLDVPPDGEEELERAIDLTFEHPPVRLLDDTTRKEQKAWDRKAEERAAQLGERAGAANSNMEASRDVTPELIDAEDDTTPVAYHLGVATFCGLELAISRDVLVPRAGTEALVRAVLAVCQETACTSPCILDIGTGSGCILLACLAALPHARGVGTDLSPAAIEQALENASRLGFAARANFLEGDMGRLHEPECADLWRAQSSTWPPVVGGAPVTATDSISVDVVVCNPPYLKASDALGATARQREHEPDLALYAGKDGLDLYRALAASLRALCRAETPHDPAPLHRGAHVILEAPPRKVQRVAELFNFLRLKEVTRDARGARRCLILVNEGGVTSGSS